MKRLLFIVCMLCAGLLCAARSTSSLWKEYEAAKHSDNPQKQLEILEKIGKIALKGRMHWDYWRYWDEKVGTVSSINWKLRDSISKVRKEALTRYDEPVVSVSSPYLWEDNALVLEYIRKNALTLRKGKNTRFWERLGWTLRKCLANDYEYAVWSCARQDTQTLRTMLLERHSKEAVDMMFRVKEIEEEFDSLSTFTSQSSDFSALYGKCLEFNKLKKSFTQEDGLLVENFSVEGIIDNLTGREISVVSPKSNAEAIGVVVRNIGKIVFELRQGGKTVFKTEAENPRNSFYARDTILLPLMPIDDGDYEIVCRDASDKNMCSGMEFHKRSISLVCVAKNGGWEAFAFESSTLNGLDSADLYIMLKTGTIKTSLSGFDRKGFVPIPRESVQKMAGRERGGKLVVEAISKDGTRMLSQPVAIAQMEDEPEVVCSESFFFDRPYYSLGDTIKFKVLAYSQKRGEKPQIRPYDKLELELRSPEGECSDRCSLTLNEFGSSAGQLAINGKSNGMWSIHSSRHCAWLRVEDPHLSPYALDFDSEGRAFRPGDTIEVGGTIRRLDGQSAQGMELRYEISGKYTDKTFGESGTILSGEEGRFALKFKSDESIHYYQIKVTLSDTTGQSDEFTTERFCSPARFSCQVINPQKGYLELEESRAAYIVSNGEAAVRFSSLFSSLAIKYTLQRGTSLLSEGSCMAGDTVRFNLEGYPDGIFTLTCATVGEAGEYSRNISFLKTGADAESLCSGVGLLIMPGSGNSLHIGSSTDEYMVCIILSDDSGKTLGTETAHIIPAKGKGGSLKQFRFDRMNTEPFKADVILFNKEGSILKQFEFNKKTEALPLSFKNLPDELHPRQKGRITLRSEPGTEAAIAVYDKAMDSFSGSRFATPRFMPTTKNARFSFASGVNRLYGGATVRSLAKNAMAGEYQEFEESEVYQETIPFALANDALQEPTGAGGGIVRTDFSKALAFIPFARADENGLISFDFTCSDRTSTFLVDVFAHNKDLKCAVTDTQIVVKLPLQITVNEPRLLRSGDRLTLWGTIYNSTGADICDTLEINGSRTPFSVRAGGQAHFRHDLQVPPDSSGITLAISFHTDAIIKTIPVIKASQTIVEAHSAVLPQGADKDSIRKEIASKFINFSPCEVSEKEIPILDMLYEALPSQIDTTSRNAISISGSILSAELAKIGNLAATISHLRERLAACRNADGGFGWISGMKSNPQVTAAVLERLARCSGFEALSHSAAAYLDSVFIRTYSSNFKPVNGISLPQYLYVRSMYPLVGFNSAGADGGALKAMRKDVKRFLTPGRDRGEQGHIMNKARRALTLRLLASSNEGILLAEALGINTLTRRKLEKSERLDVASLREYGVKHPSGGTYFPNAVMPWRGLMESELYAHTLLHRVTGDDDICLWMMLQKETQKWNSDPSCTDAVAETLSSGEAILQTRVLALKAESGIPLEKISAAGNGMSLHREILRGGKPLAEGDTLHTGERITVRCSVGSEENRSFVVLHAPYAASLRLVNQKSGFDWITGAYRNVTPQATEYWFDVFPEEGFTFCEDFFVVQEGIFASGVFTVESLYADHYRANDENCYLCSLNKSL